MSMSSEVVFPLAVNANESRSSNEGVDFWNCKYNKRSGEFSVSPSSEFCVILKEFQNPFPSQTIASVEPYPLSLDEDEWNDFILRSFFDNSP